MTAMILVTKSLVAIVHVFARINVEVFSLRVLDFEGIVFGLGRVLPKVSSHNWSGISSPVLHNKTLEDPSHTKNAEESVAWGKGFELRCMHHDFESKPSTDEPSDSASSNHLPIKLG